MKKSKVKICLKFGSIVFAGKVAPAVQLPPQLAGYRGQSAL
jgi:hypothetical protein